MKSLVDALAAALNEQPNQTARELCRVLAANGDGVWDRTAVNRILYHTFERFRSDGAATPRWSLAPVAPPTRSTPRLIARARALLLSKVHPNNEPPHISLRAWQEEALEKWAQAGRRGVVEAVTGTGKTRVGIAAVFEEIRLHGKALVIVPTIELQHQWIVEVRKQWLEVRVGAIGGGQHATFDQADVLVSVVNSLRDETNIDWSRVGLIVADECHRYGAESNLRALDDRVPRRLGLTATFARADGAEKYALGQRLGGICFCMTFERAIREGIIAHFTVALIGVGLTPLERVEYDRADDAAKRTRLKLIRTFGVPAEPLAEFIHAVARLALSGDDAGVAARAYQSAQARRREVLASAREKQSALTKIAPAIRNSDRTICFAQTKTAADEAAARIAACGIMARSIHSGHSTSVRHQALNDFKERRVQALAAPQILDEGIDVPEADLGVVLAAFRSKRQMIQRLGRVLRVKQEDRLARLAIFYVRDTPEDPTEHGHEVFLDAITSVADHVANFREPVDFGEVVAFLCHSDRKRAPACYPRYSPQAPKITTPKTSEGPVTALIGFRDLPPAKPGIARMLPGDVIISCPYCHTTVIAHPTSPTTVGLFAKRDRLLLHSCKRRTGPLNAIPLSQAPRAAWAAVMQLKATGNANNDTNFRSGPGLFPDKPNGKRGSSTDTAHPSPPERHVGSAGPHQARHDHIANRDWGRCASCGTSIAAVSLSDLCARCAR